MQLKILSSGSKGNCYILSTPTGSLMLDCGLPWWEIQKGLNFDISHIKACLVTHCHGDHIKAVRDVLRNGIDVWLDEETMRNMPEEKYPSYHLPYLCEPKSGFKIADFQILPFDIQHDCPGGLGYLIQYSPTFERFLYLTDSFYCKYRFRHLSYIAIECNYIKETLDANIEAGLIDESQKRRLLKSHFSLEHVKQFLKANDLSECRKIILLHLSNANSDAARMVREIQELTGIETVAAEAGLKMELSLWPY